MSASGEYLLLGLLLLQRADDSYLIRVFDRDQWERPITTTTAASLMRTVSKQIASSDVAEAHGNKSYTIAHGLARRIVVAPHA